MKPPTLLPLRLLAIVASFTILFYNARLGVNLLLFELIALNILWPKWRANSMRNWPTALAIAVILSAAAVAWHASSWTIFVNAAIGFTFMGAMCLPKARSVFAIWFNGFYNVLASFHFAQNWLNNAARNSNVRLQHRAASAIKYLLPLAVIAFFVALYANANTTFSETLVWLGDWYIPLGDWLAQHLDGALIATTILGIMLSIILLFNQAEEKIEQYDRCTSDFIPRKGTTPTSQPKGLHLRLRSEWRLSLFLFTGLNLALLYLNFLEVTQHWFGFEWHGQYLKDVVHEGTGTLILSLFTSMLVILYCFRARLNFYPGKALKWLALLWIAQNAMLCVGVVIRTSHYISYFALASGRIALLFVLIWVFIALISLWIKVRTTRSLFYLLRVNGLSALIIAGISALPDWEVVMAKYNVQNAQSSFLHLDYLSGFEPEVLPYIDLAPDTLEAIHARQMQIMPFLTTSDRNYYMDRATYVQRIEMKAAQGREELLHDDWRSWTVQRGRLQTYLSNRSDSGS